MENIKTKMEKFEKEEKRISKSLVTKEFIKSVIIFTVILGGIYFIITAIMWAMQFDPTEDWTLEVFQLIQINLLIYQVIIPWITLVSLCTMYYAYFVKNFSFRLTESHILIRHGIWTKKKATIPYSRVQNISIVQGVFDRIFGIFTIMVETAGAAGVGKAAQGIGKPEGYMPGVKDPFVVEKEMKQMLDKYNVLPSGLEDKIFKPQELAFDNFISYVLTKIRPADDLLNNNVKSLRDSRKLSAVDLAGKVGVKETTIEQLETGRYTPSLSLAYKIAKELGCKIEDLFKF